MNEKEMKKILKEIEKLLIEKSKTYGDTNIEKIGREGVIIRIEEKVERLKNMLKNNIEDKETREDNWKDIAGYAIIGTMLERNKFFNKKK